MGIADDILNHPEAALAALAFQIELGAVEAIGDSPVNRYAGALKPAILKRSPGVEVAKAEAANAEAGKVDAGKGEKRDPVAVARQAAAAAMDLPALRDSIAAFELCELKKGARTTVFANGNPMARVMILGDADSRMAHGSREMPVWGPVFHRVEEDQDFALVRVRRLVEYVRTRQAK